VEAAGVTGGGAEAGEEGTEADEEEGAGAGEGAVDQVRRVCGHVLARSLGLPFSSRQCTRCSACTVSSVGPDRRLHAAHRDTIATLDLVRTCMCSHPTVRAHFTARARRTRWSFVRVLILVSYADVMSVARLVVGNRPDPAVNSLLEFMSSVGAMSMQVPLLPLGRDRCGKY
jgi:hypothetical protein